MVRAPCCDKTGLKKGPWSSDEDQMLVAYVTAYGHANWRALPKQAGLSRCGKSCRLRWTNYLRPDLKRGNFSDEEEATIVSLHEKLGNRWSAIAARLPGRTDNEIKNVWNTYIKKRLIQQNHDHESKPKIRVSTSKGKGGERATLKHLANTQMDQVESKPMTRAHQANPMSPEWSCISSSSGTDFSSMSNNNAGMIKQDHEYCMASGSQQDMFDIDESFWSEALSTENSNASIDAVPILSTAATAMINEPLVGELPKDDDDDSMNFWLSILMEAGDI